MPGNDVARKCDECGENVELSQTMNHAQSHWGEKLKNACEKNPLAKERIESLTGVKF